MTERQTIPVALGLLVLGLFTACTSGSAAAEPDVESYAVVASVADVGLPLDPYQITQRDYLNLRRAGWRLTGRCVRRYGGEYTLPEVAVLTGVPSFDNQHQRRYGIFDRVSAVAHGYRVAEDQLPPGENQAFAWNPSAAELLLLRGPGAGSTPSQLPMDEQGMTLPEGGCDAESDRILAGEFSEEDAELAAVSVSLADQLSVESYRRSESDSRVRAVMSEWSVCMSQSGYSYADVFEPNNLDWPDPVGEEEKSTAMADVRCKEATNVVGVWMSVEAAYQDQSIAKNAEALKLALDYNQAQNVNAAAVLAE